MAKVESMSVLSDPGGNVPQYPLPSSSISQNYSEETVTGLLKDSFTVTKNWTQTTSLQLRNQFNNGVS